MKCPNCGFDNPRSEIYCLNCSNSLKGLSTGKRINRTPPILFISGAVVICILSLLLYKDAIFNHSHLVEPEETMSAYKTESTIDMVFGTTLQKNSMINRIAFVSNRDGDDEIFVMDIDGNNQTQLTFNDIDDSLPIWSPDGSRIAYIADDTPDSYLGYSVLMTIDIDGEDNISLHLYGNEYLIPVEWNSIGQKILIEESVIYIIDADGSDKRQITSLVSDNLGQDANWSPDGTLITYSRITGEDKPITNIFIMNEDGTELKQITFFSENSCYEPTWSPDGKRIAFEVEIDGYYELFIIDSDGTNLIQLTENDRADDYHPIWSPDGTKILYVSRYINNEGINNSISVIDLENGFSAPLFTEINKYARPNYSWSPDGELIVFDSISDGDYEIYVICVDGTNLKQITNNNDMDKFPMWSP